MSTRPPDPVKPRPSIVVRYRGGWWYWHCRPCGNTRKDGILTQPLAVESGLAHLAHHRRPIGFSRGGVVRPGTAYLV